MSLPEKQKTADLPDFLQGYWGGNVPKESQVGLRIKTRRALEEVEAWLDAHCGGDWDVKIAGVNEDGGGRLWKSLEVVFASPDDRDRFREHLAG